MSSEYEKLRHANIARNRQVMIDLGLEDAEVLPHEKKRRKRCENKANKENAPSRRSQRLAQIPAEPVEERRRPQNVPRKRVTRGSKVGTASYEHTSMRVRTMSEGELWTRMRRIEKARGQHAITKLRLSADLCRAQGYFELAEACGEAIRRVQAAAG